MVQRLSAHLVQLGVTGTAPLVGLSGGTDSTALAIGLGEASRSGRLRPRLAHVEHRVRPGAEQDAATVLGTAEELRLPLSVRAIPDGAIAAHSGAGPEEAMRRERYLVLARLAEESGCTSVMTAHHADDQAETVLGHLIHGPGLDGAAGIRPSTTLMVPWWPSPSAGRPLVVIRPLLAERRTDLRALVAGSGLTTVDDATNGDVDRTRAALRHRVLPVLEEIHPGAALALARFGEVAQAAVEVCRPNRSVSGSPRMPLVDGFRDEPIPEQRLAIREWVASCAGPDLTFERTEAIRRWVERDGSGSLEIGGGWSIRRAGRTIELHGHDGDRRADTT